MIEKVIKIIYIVWSLTSQSKVLGHVTLRPTDRESNLLAEVVQRLILLNIFLGLDISKSRHTSIELDVN